MLRISETTLKRMVNYERVMALRLAEANSRQWRVMTLEVMQEYETLRQKAQAVISAMAYARYLHRVQNGQAPAGDVYGEPFLNNSLVGLMQALDIPVEEV